MAREIMFKISLVVFITTNHAITYTNLRLSRRQFFSLLVTKSDWHSNNEIQIEKYTCFTDWSGLQSLKIRESSDRPAKDLHLWFTSKTTRSSSSTQDIRTTLDNTYNY